jgi:hypothetical protein
MALVTFILALVMLARRVWSPFSAVTVAPKIWLAEKRPRAGFRNLIWPVYAWGVRAHSPSGGFQVRSAPS